MKRTTVVLLVAALATLVADQVTKWMVASAFTQQGETREVLSWFSLTYVFNPAGAFGMLSTMSPPLRTAFFLLLPPLVLGLLWWAYIRNFGEDEVLGPVAIGLVFGGALGNLIDRIRLGYVIDFIDWHYPTDGSCLPLFSHFTADACHWPRFNLADSAISTAMVLLILHAFVSERREKASARPGV